MKRYSLICTLALAAAALFSFSPSHALAQYTFTNIADTTTPAPVGMLNPVSGPTISNGVVAFAAQYDDGALEGIFTGTGGPLTSIVQEGDPAPTGTFTDVGAATISAAGVAFFGRYDDGKEGVFVKSGSTLTTIAKTGDVSPSGTFTYFNDPVSSGDNVAFTASATGGAGIYVSKGGVLSTIAALGDLGPTGTPFNGLVRPAISADNVAFHGTYPGGNGVFVGNGGPLTSIVKTGDPAPSGTFGGGGSANISGSTVAFTSTYGPVGGPFTSGVFTGDGGPVTTIALIGDPAPSGTFNAMGPTGVKGNTVVFDALFDGFSRSGIFVADGESITAVIKQGDPLFGSHVTIAGMDRGGLDSDGSGRMAFFYQLADGREGIAIATPIPEPSALMLTALAMIGTHFLFRVRRRYLPGIHSL